MTRIDGYEDWPFPFGKWKGKTIPEIPTSYLDWLLGERWFIENKGNLDWLQAIGKELVDRRKSGYEPPAGQDEEWERQHR